MVEFSPQNLVIPDQPDTSFLDATAVTNAVLQQQQSALQHQPQLNQQTRPLMGGKPPQQQQQQQSPQLQQTASKQAPVSHINNTNNNNNNVNMESQLETLHLTPFRTDQDDHTFGSLLIEDESPSKQQQQHRHISVSYDISMDAPMLVSIAKSTYMHIHLIQ